MFIVALFPWQQIYILEHWLTMQGPWTMVQLQQTHTCHPFWLWSVSLKPFHLELWQGSYVCTSMIRFHFWLTITNKTATWEFLVLTHCLSSDNTAAVSYCLRLITSRHLVTDAGYIHYSCMVPSASFDTCRPNVLQICGQDLVEISICCNKLLKQWMTGR